MNSSSAVPSQTLFYLSSSILSSSLHLFFLSTSFSVVFTLFCCLVTSQSLRARQAPVLPTATTSHLPLTSTALHQQVRTKHVVFSVCWFYNIRVMLWWYVVFTLFILCISYFNIVICILQTKVTTRSSKTCRWRHWPIRSSQRCQSESNCRQVECQTRRDLSQHPTLRRT